MNIREYMERRCVCGRPRSEHVHFQDPLLTRRLRVLPVPNPNDCIGFLDEIELELGGNPADNRHLGPLVQEQLRAWRANELASAEREEPEV